MLCRQRKSVCSNGCAVLDSPKYSTSDYPESGIIPPKCVFAVRDRVQCRHEHPGDFQRVTQCIQVTAFHKMVNINSRATQEIDFQRLFFIADPGSGRCGSSGCSIACSMSTRPCSSTPASRNCWSIAARSLASI